MRPTGLRVDISSSDDVAMKAAMRAISALIGLLCLAGAIKFGMEGSWPTAVLFFLFFGGAEFTAYALGVGTTDHRETDQ